MQRAGKARQNDSGVRQKTSKSVTESISLAKEVRQQILWGEAPGKEIQSMGLNMGLHLYCSWGAQIPPIPVLPLALESTQALC